MKLQLTFLLLFTSLSLICMAQEEEVEFDPYLYDGKLLGRHSYPMMEGGDLVKFGTYLYMEDDMTKLFNDCRVRKGHELIILMGTEAHIYTYDGPNLNGFKSVVPDTAEVDMNWFSFMEQDTIAEKAYEALNNTSKAVLYSNKYWEKSLDGPLQINFKYDAENDIYVKYSDVKLSEVPPAPGVNDDPELFCDILTHILKIASTEAHQLKGEYREGSSALLGGYIVTWPLPGFNGKFDRNFPYSNLTFTQFADAETLNGDLQNLVEQVRTCLHVDRENISRNRNNGVTTIQYSEDIKIKLFAFEGAISSLELLVEVHD